MLVPRRTTVAYIFAALFLLNIFYFYLHRERQPFSSLRQNQSSRLWQQLHPLLNEYKPNCSQPTLRGSAGTQRFDPLNETPRSNYISNIDEIQLPMQAVHDGFVHAIHNLKIDDAYIPGTTGIVSSAGGTYLPTFLISLLLLRRTGSTLPVELFMKDQTEYEPLICETILPPLGAKCLVLSDILGGQDSPQSMEKIEGFQLKSFALLFSSFEKFIWLDADCVPLHDPAIILNFFTDRVKSLVQGGCSVKKSIFITRAWGALVKKSVIIVRSIIIIISSEH